MLLSITVMKLRCLLKLPLTHLEHLPQDQHNCEALYLYVDNEYVRQIYEPIVLQTECTDSPSWCAALVELLKFVFWFKEWNHTMQNQTITEFDNGHHLKFLIQMNAFLKSIDDSKKHEESSEQSEEDESDAVVSQVSDGK